MRHWIYIVAVMALSCSCESNQFDGKGSTKNKSDDKPRPTEQGEGVAGYLTDPDSLSYSEENGQTKVSGGAGAVARTSDSSEPLEACLQEVGADELATILGAQSEFGGDSVKTLARGQVAADGSFELVADSVAKGLLAVNVSGFCDGLAAQGFNPSGTSVVFHSPGESGFSKAEVFEPGESGASDTVGPTDADLTICKDPADCAGFLTLEVVNSQTGDPIESAATVTFQVPACADPVDVSCDQFKSSEVLNDVKSGVSISYPDATFVVKVEAPSYLSKSFLIQPGNGTDATMVKLDPVN